MSKCKYCGLDAGTHACDPKDVTINMAKQNIAILRQQVSALEARNKELVEALKTSEHLRKNYQRS